MARKRDREELEDQPGGGQLRRQRKQETDTSAMPLQLAPFGLEGKKASEPTIVRWVARNVDNPRPDPHECPDPFAWTLLRQCREVEGFTAFFIEKLWSKLLPSRSQLDTGAPKEIDGKPTLELIAKIEAMRDEAKEES